MRWMADWLTPKEIQGTVMGRQGQGNPCVDLIACRPAFPLVKIDWILNAQVCERIAALDCMTGCVQK